MEAADPDNCADVITADDRPASAAMGAAEGASPGAQQDVQKKEHKAGKRAPVLPWMRVPVTIDPSDGIPLPDISGLDPRLHSALGTIGIEALFPVQSVVWRETAGGASSEHDICIAAPTGSGKTLAYLLPLVQALSRRCAPRLRALIVLPTRDLALQVHSVLSTLCTAVGLVPCAACGSATVAAEAEVLAPGRVDIVVATPGRLIAHLEGTPGFSLQQLRFVVVDETDRLLRQGYQGWLSKVLAASAAGEERAAKQGALPAGGEAAQSGSGSGPSWRVVKFVVSATLTRDPSKVDRLGLHCPRYIAMTAPDDHRYKLPPGLNESKVVVGAEHKPAALAVLLAGVKGQPAIVFTSSVEATHRLHLVLRALPSLVGSAVEYSAALPPAARSDALAAFKSGSASVLVCSDAMTRGMDVEGVAVVINYDAPVYVKTYVHRAGRTARAGRGGRVVTLLRREDVRHFKGMLRKADNAYVRDEPLEGEMVSAVRGEVEAALKQMAAVLQREAEEAERPGAGAGIEAKSVNGAARAAAAGLRKAAEGGGAEKGGRAPKRRKLLGVPELLL